MTSMSDVAAPLPPLPLPTVTLPPLPPMAIARKSSATGRGDVPIPRPMLMGATPPADALLLEPAAPIEVPGPPVELAVRFMIVPVDVASIDESEVAAAAAA